MENNTRQTSAAPTQFMVWIRNDNKIVITTFKLLEEQLGFKPMAASIGCNTPNFDTRNTDARIIYNEGVSWGPVKHCAAGVHEWGHQRGFAHTNETYRIMRYPLYLEFPYC